MRLLFLVIEKDHELDDCTATKDRLRGWAALLREKWILESPKSISCIGDAILGSINALSEKN
jgi:hypothetical protein